MTITFEHHSKEAKEIKKGLNGFQDGQEIDNYIAKLVEIIKTQGHTPTGHIEPFLVILTGQLCISFSV